MVAVRSSSPATVSLAALAPKAASVWPERQLAHPRYHARDREPGPGTREAQTVRPGLDLLHRSQDGRTPGQSSVALARSASWRVISHEDGADHRLWASGKGGELPGRDVEGLVGMGGPGVGRGHGHAGDCL